MENHTRPSPSPNFQRKIEQYTKSILARQDRRVRSNGEFAEIKRNMEWVYGRQASLFCIDIEAWERNGKIVTEIGVCVYDPKDQEHALSPVLHTTHIIVEENYRKRNGNFVPDHMDNFMGGTSVKLPLNRATKLVQNLVDKYFGEWATGWCMFVGHDVKNDFDYLAKIGVRVPQDCLVLDTQKVFACSHGKHGASLYNALRTVKQPFAFLHNAGNDAYFTVLLALKLCDPEARLALKLDILEQGEQHGSRREYVKSPANLSAVERGDFYKILAEYGL